MPKKNLIVKTIAPKNLDFVAVQEKAPSTQEHKKTTASTPPEKKNSPKKNTAKPKPQPSKKSKTPPPPPKNAKPQIPNSLLKDLEKSFAELEKTTDIKPSRKKEALRPLEIDKKDQSLNAGTQEENLIGYLQQSLLLPDFGEVKIQLTLHRDGRVAKVVVLRSESEKNRTYLEKHLPLLHFPNFKEAHGNKEDTTFVLTFCNAL